MVACLVAFLCSVFPGFNWFLGPIGLVDEVGPGFVLWGFPVTFFLFLGCEIGNSLGFADFGS